VPESLPCIAGEARILLNSKMSPALIDFMTFSGSSARIGSIISRKTTSDNTKRLYFIADLSFEFEMFFFHQFSF
jgi:hypothetical protein